MIVKEKDLAALREQLAGKEVVFAIGTFDIFHEGHLSHLEWCAQLGDVLVVAVNNDQRTKNRKGLKRPIFGQEARLRLIDALRMVDYAVLVEDTEAANSAPVKTAKHLRPDKIGLGSDQSSEYFQSWREAFPDIEVLVSPNPEYNSTSDIIRNLLDKHAG
jgi:D-beta-D-heptose 7-phosphate kinase/D-beta-D-heptose 1-phosphate adenosyltransferase